MEREEKKKKINRKKGGGRGNNEGGKGLLSYTQYRLATSLKRTTLLATHLGIEKN